MKRSIFAVTAFALLTGVASARLAGSGDRWWDIINTNRQVIWLDKDRIWRSGNRAFGFIRIARAVNGFSDYTTAPDLIAATDCRAKIKAFATNEDYQHLPLSRTDGMGVALIAAICMHAH